MFIRIARKTSLFNSAENKTAIQLAPSRAGHARLACEVNRNGGQQQNRAQRHSEQRELQPAEVIQPSGNASLDAVGIPRLKAGEGCQILRFALVLTACILVACAPPTVDTRATTTQGGGARPASSAGLPTGRIAMGEQLAKRPGSVLPQSCIECHGADGNNPLAPIYPRIGGQYPDYLAHALLAYRGNVRTHPMMTAQASQLSDQDIADLAAYFASRPSQLRDLASLQ